MTADDRRYKTPASARAAVTDKLRAQARDSPWALPDLQRQYAYDQLIERLYRLDDRWVVKGATALLARRISVRHTIDIDLYRPGAIADGNEHTWHVIDEMTAVAAEAGRTLPQVAVRWLMQRPGVTAPIIGPRKPEYLDDLLGAADWSLTPEQMERLDVASRPESVPYPYFFD